MVQVERTGKKCTKRKGLIFFITRFARTAKIGLSWDLGGAGAAGTKKNRSQILSRARAEAKAEAEAKSPAPGEVMRKEGGGGGQKKSLGWSLFAVGREEIGFCAFALVFVRTVGGFVMQPFFLFSPFVMRR